MTWMVLIRNLDQFRISCLGVCQHVFRAKILDQPIHKSCTPLFHLDQSLRRNRKKNFGNDQSVVTDIVRERNLAYFIPGPPTYGGLFIIEYHLIFLEPFPSNVDTIFLTSSLLYTPILIHLPLSLSLPTPVIFNFLSSRLLTNSL